METQSIYRLKPGNVLVGALVFAGLYLSSRYSYLLFHSIAEIFSVSVAGTIFMVTWNTRRSPDTGYFSFLGIGYLFVATMDFLHLLAYKGMGVFPGYDANLPTQLWIATRYVMAVTFLAAPAFSGRGLKHRLVFSGYATGAALLLASIFAWKIFPDCFIEGSGLTSFKIASEYVVSGVLLVSIVFLVGKKEHFDREVLRLLVSSVAVAVCSEMAFTLYTDVYGLTNLFGHFLQILSFFLVYRAIVGTDLVRKHELGRRLESELAERKIIEERTRHLASFPQYNPNPIVEVYGSGKIAFWNPAAEKMLETLGMDRGDVGVFLPADLDGILEELEKKSETTFDREITVKDRIFGLAVHLAPQFNVVRIYARDITERKRAEEELRTAKEQLEERVAERTAKLSIFADLLQKELAGRRKAEGELALNEERFRSVVTGSLVGILILRDGRISYMNPEQKRLFGDLPEEFPLREYPDVHPEDRDRFEMFCDSILSDKSGSLDIDLRFYPFGGSSAGVDLRWVHCRATVIRSGAEKAYLVNMVDITRLKEMEHQVRTREKLASLGHVAAGIAHEIRSPLSGINIYLAALQQVHGDSESMEPEARDQAAEIALQIQSAAHRIESVIKKVMDFTRPAAPRKELVDVGMAVENAIDFTAANLVKSGITLDRSRLVSLPKCSADLHMITQVVMNLISNAVHAMEERRGPRTIEVSSTVEEGRIVLFVSDSGPGVPLAIRDKIFDPFYTTRKDGYGIGLSFCRRVIEDHAGTLEVGGNRMGGAEFRIGIPLPGEEIST